MPSPCVEWVGYKDSDGYGRSESHGEFLTHRIAYVRANGPIPADLEIDHLCRNRACVNPEHLEPVTHAENMRRRSLARTHCKNQHELTPENTYSRPGYGISRACRACIRDANRRYRMRRSA